MILKEKIEDFLHHDYVRMVYIKKSSKIRLKFLGKLSRKISKKGVFIKNISKIYQKYIKRLSKRYQKYINPISKGYQNALKRPPTENRLRFDLSDFFKINWQSNLKRLKTPKNAKYEEIEPYLKQILHSFPLLLKIPLRKSRNQGEK